MAIKVTYEIHRRESPPAFITAMVKFKDEERTSAELVLTIREAIILRNELTVALQKCVIALANFRQEDYEKFPWE